MDRTKEKVYLKRKLWKIFTLKRPQLLQKMLAVGVSLSLLLGAVPLGGQGVYVAAAGEPTKMTSPITVPEANLDATGNDKTKWKKNGDVYETQNQGSNSDACKMTVPVEVTAGYAELEFEWKVSSEAGWDILRFELKDTADNVLQSNQKSGEETDFDNVVLKLDKGTYTLTFTYQGDSSSAKGADTGYVKNLTLVTYSGVSAIPVTMYAEPDDLTNSDNFSLATADSSKVGKISFGTRPSEVKYYKYDWSTENSVGAGPITWLIAGSDATNGLVLYSEEPLVSAESLVSGANSQFQPLNGYTYNTLGYFTAVGWDKDKPPEGVTYSDGTPDTVYANHWGASNARTSLRNLVPALDASTKYFKKTEGALMAESSVKTYDMLNKSGENPIEYTTADVLYAPRSLDNSGKPIYGSNVQQIRVGADDALKIDKAHWGGRSWLRSPDPTYSNFALGALPGSYVSSGNVIIGSPSVSAAFRLDLSSVLFASAASAESSAEGEKFEAIPVDTPMTLRLDGTVLGKPLHGINTPKVEAGVITYTAPEKGARLMVLATGSDGATYQYFKAVTGDGSLELSDITSSLPAGMTYTARAWLETDVDAGHTLTYATKATDDFAFCTSCTIVPVSQLDATCTEPGHQAHWKCSVCGHLFSDAEGKNPITEPPPIAAKGHSITAVSQLDATCTEPGYEAHYQCSVCGQLFSDTDGENPITEPEVIPAGHDSSGDWQKDATHHWKKCKNFLAILDKAEHTWDGGTVTTKPTASAPGVKTYTCSVCGQTKTETIPKLDQENNPGGGGGHDNGSGGSDAGNNGPDDAPNFRPGGSTDPATWGTAVTRGDIPHWVDADGTTSVQVTADDGIIWLKEDSEGTSAWYGLDNSADVFVEGSRFWVRWLSKKSDPTLWQYYYDKFDTEHKTDVESDNLWIFLIGVTAPDGTEYTDFGAEVPLYIQKGPDWDDNDIRSVFISGASDEVLLSHFHGKMDYPESALHPDAEFYKIMLSHFSPYAMFDELTDKEKAELGLPSTGDISTELLISGLAIVIVSSLGVMLRLITNKKKFEE